MDSIITSVASGQGMTADKAVVPLELAFSAEDTVEVLVLTAGARHAITSTLAVNLVPAWPEMGGGAEGVSAPPPGGARR